jgi:hypothetical protein
MAVTVDEFLGVAQRLPFRPLREALEDRPFIVLAPHPDDESLGCGGLIAEACRQVFVGRLLSSAMAPGRIRTAKPIRRTG